jgi:putative membrane protein
MSVPMLIARRLHLIDRQPPEEITQNVGSAARLRLTGTLLRVATMLAHLAFGAVAGACFALVLRWLSPHVRATRVGVLYGGLIWALTYRTTLPALRLVRPADAAGQRRDGLMLIAHLVFGAVLGRLLR